MEKSELAKNRIDVIIKKRGGGKVGSVGTEEKVVVNKTEAEEEKPIVSSVDLRNISGSIRTNE